MRSEVYLICYDVATSGEGGARRLRQVARACESRGQRVQYSVFELTLTAPQAAALLDRLVRIIDPAVDSLRVYGLGGRGGTRVQTFGVDRAVDFDGPLIV